MNAKISRTIDLIMEYLLKGLVLALPLFFLFGKETEFAEQSLLLIIAALLLVVWLARIIINGKIAIQRTPLDAPILIFLLITGLSAAAGADKFSSFFGYYGKFSDGWLVLLACAVLYFTAFNIFAKENAGKIFSFIKTFIYSGSLAGVLLLSAFLGLMNKIISGAFAGILLRQLNLFFIILLIITIGILFQIKNFNILRFARLAGAPPLPEGEEQAKAGVDKKNFKSHNNSNNGGVIFYLITIVLSLSILFLANFQNLPFVKQKLPAAAKLDYASARNIAWQEIKRNPLLGGGPGSFAYAFSAFRQPSFNQSPNWQLRFDRSYSQILEWAATIGLAGLISYFLILVLLAYLLSVYFKKYKEKIMDDNLLVGLSAAFGLLFITQFFYVGDIIFSVLFWLILSLILSKISAFDGSAFKAEKYELFGAAEEINKPINSGKKLIKAVVILLFLAASAGLLSFAAVEVKYIYAEYCYAISPNTETGLLQAVKFNPHRLIYQIGLAKYYLNSAYGESLKQGNGKNNILVKADIDNSIKYAKTALYLNPDSVVANETLGMIYRDIRPLTAGSEQWAADYFKRALELEPSNPVLATELGKAYLNLNDINAAENYFLKALALKSDYSDAKFSLAKAYAKANKENEAIDLLLELASQSDEPEVYYELGRLHYNKGDVERAIGEFKKVLELSPNHSNSLYSLGLAYQLLGEKNKALLYFNKALELNPGNEEVMKKIGEVKE